MQGFSRWPKFPSKKLIEAAADDNHDCRSTTEYDAARRRIGRRPASFNEPRRLEDGHRYEAHRRSARITARLEAPLESDRRKRWSPTCVIDFLRADTADLS